MLPALGTYEFSPGRALRSRSSVPPEPITGCASSNARRKQSIGQISVKRGPVLDAIFRKTLERITRSVLTWNGEFEAGHARSWPCHFRRGLKPSGYFCGSIRAIVSLWLFQKFPVLTSLWCLTIRQKGDHVVEFLERWRRIAVLLETSSSPNRSQTSL